MSDILYPIGLIQQLDTERVDRTLIDQFENGSTSARAYWSAKNFKRRFQISHAPLKQAEYKYLRSFYAQRSGQYDSFWFRDNIGRSGNASVRFSATLKESRSQQVVGVTVNLDEVAPIRSLPAFDELATAAGSSPVLWYDANREFYLQHVGAVILDPSAATWDAMEAYRAVWQGGSNLNLGNILGQYQTYNFSGTEWAKTAANIAELAGTQPACTIFAIARQSSTSTKQILFSIGAASSTHALGIQLTAANKYAPWIGGSETWTSALSTNSAADTYRSVAAVWGSTSNSASLYVNAALIGSDSNTRSLTAGPATLGAAPDGSLICNPSNAMANSNIAHVLVFAGALTLAQIKAVHNLIGYQYGIATVA